MQGTTPRLRPSVYIRRIPCRRILYVLVPDLWMDKRRRGDREDGVVVTAVVLYGGSDVNKQLLASQVRKLNHIIITLYQGWAERLRGCESESDGFVSKPAKTPAVCSLPHQQSARGCFKNSPHLAIELGQVGQLARLASRHLVFFFFCCLLLLFFFFSAHFQSQSLHQQLRILHLMPIHYRYCGRADGTEPTD